jgi:tyrosyl-tRNA synthetase
MAGRGGVRSTSFKPGQSGNPGGRPKLTQDELDALTMAKQFAPDAIRALHEIATSKTASDKARVTAAEAIINRVYGKPKETVESTIKHERRNESDILAELVALGLVPSERAAEGTAGGKGGTSVH